MRRDAYPSNSTPRLLFRRFSTDRRCDTLEHPGGLPDPPRQRDAEAGRRTPFRCRPRKPQKYVGAVACERALLASAESRYGAEDAAKVFPVVIVVAPNAFDITESVELGTA